MINYNMRISERINKLPLDKNGCFPFTESAINNIPDVDVFIEHEVNTKSPNLAHVPTAVATSCRRRRSSGA